jgi:hypothetical protein
MRLNHSLFVLIIGFLPLLAFAEVANYRLTIQNDWTEEAHPVNYPTNAHFSWVGGGTHDNSLSFWGLGAMASEGFEIMAETGVTTAFVEEITTAGGSPLEWRHWFCPPNIAHASCGSLTEEFTISRDEPLITLNSMLGPSPDWFIGVSGLSLLDNQGEWIRSITIPLILYDAGTEEGTTPNINNPETNPLSVISLLEYNGETGDYELTDEEYIIGSITFELVPNSTTVPFPRWHLFAMAFFLVVVGAYIKASK